MEDKNEIIEFDNEDSKILNKKGWFFVTHYRSRDSGQSTNAYNNAVKKALLINRKTGLRSYEKDGFTYWEVWELW